MKKLLKGCVLTALAQADHIPAIDLYLTERDSPIELKNDNIFTLFVEKDTMLPAPCSKGFFLKFFSPYCPHCQAMAAAWIDFHQREKANVHVASIDCTADDSAKLCEEFHIQRYPTLVYCPPREPT